MFRKLAVPLALLLMLGTSGMLNAYADGKPLPDDYLIRNTATGQYLTIANADNTAGNPVVTYSADGIGYGNRWTTETTEDGKSIRLSHLNVLM